MRRASMVVTGCAGFILASTVHEGVAESTVDCEPTTISIYVERSEPGQDATICLINWRSTHPESGIVSQMPRPTPAAKETAYQEQRNSSFDLEPEEGATLARMIRELAQEGDLSPEVGSESTETTIRIAASAQDASTNVTAMARLASFDAAEGTWKRLVEYIDLESLCSPRGTLRPLTEDERIVGFRLEVIAPFSRATITVSDSGDVTYQAKPEGRPGQHGTGTVPRGTVAALAQWVQQSTFWTSKLSYDDTEDGMTLSDLSTYVVSVLTIGGEKMPATRTKRHSISCYGETESCPDDVVELIRRIKALWGKEIMDIGV